MTPDERQRLISALAEYKTGKLKTFFLSHDLAYPFENERNKYESKQKKVTDALAVAETRDGDDRVLRAAIGSFGLGDLVNDYVSPGLSELLQKIDEQSDWASVQNALMAAAANAFTDPASAITASRASIESICKHICEEQGVQYKNSDDLSTLYNKTIGALSQSPSAITDASLRQIMQGSVTIINGLAALRNTFGDAHGKGKEAPRTPESYGLLSVNIAVGITRLLLDLHSRQDASSS